VFILGCTDSTGFHSDVAYYNDLLTFGSMQFVNEDFGANVLLGTLSEQ
jgi:hypothetical protein